MSRIVRSFMLLLLLALMLVPVSPAYAQSGEPGKIIFGDNYTLASGETLEGDLVVFGGNVTIEEDADLNGNLVVFGGTISSNGNVNGDVVIFGGQIELDENAVVVGDVTIGDEASIWWGRCFDRIKIKIPSSSARAPASRITVFFIRAKRRRSLKTIARLATARSWKVR